MRYFLLSFLLWSCFSYSEEIGHECGISVVRLLKPLDYYSEPAWGLKKSLLLMEKQRNRGQDGTGLAVLKLGVPAGEEYFHLAKSIHETPLEDLMFQVTQDNASFIGEIYLGHLRYATHSQISLKNCQPFLRPSTVPSKHFAIAGNFNMTNTSELFSLLERWGLFPTSTSDTQMIVDMLSYYLDKEHERGDLDFVKVLKQAAVQWDGGYVLSGILGNGDLFICRDPSGIRPGFYYKNDEVFAAASERSALMEAFDLNSEEVLPIPPGFVLILKKNQEFLQIPFTTARPIKECTFERIYFSKATDLAIYEERKRLGKNLAGRVWGEIGGDLENAIFTYVPNSSLPAFQGLVDGIREISQKEAFSSFNERMKKGVLQASELIQLAYPHIRTEYIISKNQKVRTFISAEKKRENLLSMQLYEITKGLVKPKDTLVVVDDSIVRGVTLRDSLLKKLVLLKPKKIIIVSSAPPVCYPDCYGIDMSQLGKFVAFQAAVSLLKDRKELKVLDEVKEICFKQKELTASNMINAVQKIYAPLTLKDIEKKVAEIITPQNPDWNGEVKVIYQSLEGLYKAMPGYSGDWYFTGNYPTPGGFKVLNTSFLKWIQSDDSRSY